jgi:protein SCO1/2
MRKAVWALLALALAVVAAGCGGGGGGDGSAATTEAETPYRGIVVTNSPRAPAFRLHDEHGRVVTMADQRGRWVLMTFLYTYCPDVCPVIAGQLNQVLKTAPARRADLRVLSVSVDPKRDTPAAVRKYARDHRLLPTFRWLLGTRAELKRVWDAYNIAVLPGPKNTVSHYAVQLLIDPQGRERLAYDSQVKTADVVADLRTLERE